MKSKLISMTVALILAVAGVSGNAVGSDFGGTVKCDFEGSHESWRIPRPLWCVKENAGRQGRRALVWENALESLYAFPSLHLTLEGGGVYRFGCWVKVDKLEKDGKAGRPAVSLDWSDASGKWIGAAYAHPVDGNETDTDGWVRYEGVTSPLPTGVTQGNLLCYLRKGSIGKVRFDEFFFKADSIRMVDCLVSSAYRNTASDGNITFYASLYLNLTKHPIESLEPIFTYVAEDGNEMESAPDSISAQVASITIPVSKMAKGRNKVAFILRKHQDGGELGRTECSFERTPNVSRRVMFDEHKRAVVDGKLFLPLGMFANRLTPETICKYTNDVFNCIMLYAATPEQLDLAQTAGLKVVYNIKDRVWGASRVRKGCETREKSLRAIEEEIERVKDHPALLAWYINDESPETQIAALREVNELIRDIDPDHPTWAVTDKPWHARQFLGSYDCLGMDPYPIGNNRGGIDIAGGWAIEARAGFFDTVPMWHVPQAFNWKWFRKTESNPQHRFPDRRELESMFWQAIAAGANGLMPYAYHVMQRSLKDAEFDNAMNDVVAVMRAVKKREQVILLKPGAPVMADNKKVFCRTWEGENGDEWLLVANANRKSVTVSIKIGKTFEKAVCQDDAASVAVSSCGLEVKLNPLTSVFVKLENLKAKGKEK